MEYQGFIGQSNTSPAIAADSEKSINLFAEVLNAPGIDAKRKIVLYRVPGLALLQTLGDSPNRGLFSINGRCFAVAGGSFYELLTPTTAVLRGSLAATGTSAVQFASNTTQICFIADGLGYIFTLGVNAFAPIMATGFPNAISLTSIDTYFIVLKSGTNQFQISSPLDGFTWSALNFGSSQEPDNAVGIAQCHLYLWIFGQLETIIFQDTGAASFPFQRIPGSQIEQGLAAVGTLTTVDNTLFWLGADPRGARVFYRADGFLPTRISTHAVEFAMQGYATVADAVSYSYQENGHLFYCTSFPTANTNWTYDVSTGMWHQRNFWNTATALHTAPLARFHAYCFGMHIAADYSNGNIYQQAANLPTDNGSVIRWLRAAPHLSNEEQWIFYSYFQLDMQMGGGLPSGFVPQVMLRWSNDGGFTWSNIRNISCGLVGQYAARAITRLLGRARNRVFEVSGTDPVPVLCLVAAYLGVEVGTS